MAEVDPLTQLKDIHLPNPIGWWPLAPGWYVVFFLLLVSVCCLVYYLRKRARDAKPKNAALALLAEYKLQYANNPNSQILSAQLSELLRRVALVYFPREDVASLHGQNWIRFLDRTSKGIDFKTVEKGLLEWPFKPTQAVDMQPLITSVERWIKQRRVPCSN